MGNKENFMALVSGTDTKTQEKNRWRIENRAWLRISQEIAAQIVVRLDSLNWSQKELAERMGCSPQFINTILKGSENLTLETISKLEKALEVSLIQVLDFQQEIKITPSISHLKISKNNYIDNTEEWHTTVQKSPVFERKIA